MRQFGNILALFALMTFICPAYLWAQDDLESEMSDFEAEFEAFKLDTEREYEEFRRQCNEEYAKFLEEGWSQFKNNEGLKKPADQNGLSKDIINKAQQLTPKQVKSAKTTNARFNLGSAISGLFDSLKPDPAFKHKSVRKLLKEERRQRREAEKLAAKKQREQQRTEAERQKQLAQQQKQSSKEDGSTHPQLVNFSFYGTPMQVNVGDIQEPLHMKDVLPQTVADAWRTCAGTQYNELLCDLLELRDKYSLCDWAYLQMLSEATAAYLGRGSNEATFLTAFIYCQSGYRIRLAQSNGRLLMLYACQNTIYDQDYYELSNSKFYIYGESNGTVFLSACDHGFEKEQALSLFVDREPVFASDNSTVRTIKSILYPEMEIKVSVNQNLLRFYENYPTSSIQDNPLTRWALYANKPLDESVSQQIYPTLKNALKGLSEYEAVSRLLSLLQSGLVYEYDDKVWGHDRAFFAEETLFYPYADCEDRAILFSRLVRDLLGLKVALIYYDSSEAHLAAAVRFNEKIEGDAFIINGDNYFVCDPTNCIPRPGFTMDKEINARAQLILLN